VADDSPSALDRIERAISRIETAVAARARADAASLRRHEALRSRVTQAIAALDTLIDQGAEG
jgi:Mg2+ and Co2+ transporter CorA